MANNPFRSEPNQSNIENWGQTKFKPKKFGTGGNDKINKNQHHSGGKRKSFNNNNKFGNKKGKGNFHNKEKYKFNQVARDAKPENATPWNKYKDEIVYKQREEEQAALQANMDTSEAKEMLKQREINYRKLLIEQKKQEPTQWEDFGEEEVNKKIQKNKNNNHKSGQNKNKNNNNKQQQNPAKKFNRNSKTNFKHRVGGAPILSKKVLENFDKNKLNFKQIDAIRGVITKNTLLAKGATLENLVENMRHKKERNEKKNKNKNNN